jgi:cytochrome c-type biogenesis protein CcmH/NrfG
MIRILMLLAALLAGCATAPEPEPEPERAPPSENVAVAGLMRGADADAAAGRLGKAADAIERALRIEPRNPRLWQELARVRLAQLEYAQAENLAARSNSWAGADNALRAGNWRLIARSREARGNAQGAQAALETAERLER